MFIVEDECFFVCVGESDIEELVFFCIGKCFWMWDNEIE